MIKRATAGYPEWTNKDESGTKPEEEESDRIPRQLRDRDKGPGKSPYPGISSISASETKLTKLGKTLEILAKITKIWTSNWANEEIKHL